MGVFTLMDDYYEYALKGGELVPGHLLEIIMMFMLIAGLIVMTIVLIPFFFVGLILKPNTLKERDERFKSIGMTRTDEEIKKGWFDDYDY